MNSKNNSVFDFRREKLKAMTSAGLESIYWRQDQYGSGGIVESDVRVDGGRNLYWPWCWPREYIVEPLLAAGQADRVRHFLDFWLKCQRKDGGWLHCYDVRDGKEYPGYPETDNVAYMLAHFGNYIKATDDLIWLKKNWTAIKCAGKFLEEKYNPENKMIWGQEETSFPGHGKIQIRYSLHINCICVWGLRLAVKIARKVGDEHTATKWSQIAETIFSESISQKLWDEKEHTFAFGFTESGQRLTTPVLWMTLMPLWLFGDDFAERHCSVLDYLKRTCYNKDPKISNTYWVYNFSPLLESDKPIKNEYSGNGPWIGGLPVLIDVMISAGRFDDAREQIDKMCEFTNPENNLIPEHVNTLYPGTLGNYSVYPESYYHVDSGNLLHLSFFLTMIARHKSEMLLESM